MTILKTCNTCCSATNINNRSPKFFFIFYAVFERVKDEERMLVIVNRTGEEHKFVVPEEYQSSDKVYTLKKSRPGVVGPYGGIAIKK